MTLSVIVPVYNVKSYLDACLESICSSGDEDFEVICVDDGSTDGSSLILGEWAMRDARIRVIPKANGGVSSARNVGIDASRGEYLCFVDADDKMAEHGIDYVLHACDELDADVIVFSAVPEPADEATPWLVRHMTAPDRAPEPFSPEMALGEDASPFVWAHAFRRELVVSNGLHFDPLLTLGEDVAWLVSCLPHARSIAYVSDVVYVYRVAREGSLMDTHQKGSEQQLSRHLDVVESAYASWDRLGLLERWSEELTNWAVRYVFYAALRSSEELRGGLAVRMRDIWDVHLTQSMVEALPSQVRRMVEVARSFDDNGQSSLSSSAISRACLAWRIREYGLLDLAQTVLGFGGSRSGSGE